jgi:hypothetical protein
MAAILQSPEFCQQLLGGPGGAWVGAEFDKRRIFHQDMSSGPRGHMLSQKLFSDVSVGLFASGNQLSAA